MRLQFYMFMSGMLITGITLSYVIGGAFYGAEDAEMMNSLVAFRQASIFGLWSVPVPNFGWVITGAYHLASLDFAFFNNVPGGWVRFFFYIFSQAFMFGLMVVFSVVIFRAWGR